MNSESSERQAADDEMLPEYDFGGVRGKHYQARWRGKDQTVYGGAHGRIGRPSTRIFKESAREGIGITVSYWADLESIQAWKENAGCEIKPNRELLRCIYSFCYPDIMREQRK